MSSIDCLYNPQIKVIIVYYLQKLLISPQKKLEINWKYKNQQKNLIIIDKMAKAVFEVEENF